MATVRFLGSYLAQMQDLQKDNATEAIGQILNSRVKVGSDYSASAVFGQLNIYIKS